MIYLLKILFEQKCKPNVFCAMDKISNIILYKFDLMFEQGGNHKFCISLLTKQEVYTYDQ